MMKQNSSSNLRFIGGALAFLWGMGAIPGVVAADQYCYTTFDGFWTCTKRLSLGARIAICIVLSMILSLCLCLCMRNRRARNQEAIAAVYQIEASQIHGPPPSTYVTSFDSRSPAGYPLPSAYLHSPHNPPSSFPKTPDGYPHTPDADRLSARPTLPTPSARSARVRFEPTTERYQGSFSTKQPPQTAPVNPAYNSPGAYPFPGYSSKPSAPQQPHTAYSVGFPKPFYAGQPVQRDADTKVREIV